MCHAVRCKQCGKTTWSGCGRHVEQVRRSVPASQWCPGHPEQQRSGGILSRLLKGSGSRAG